MKACRVCGEVKELDDFHRLTKSPDGRQPRCKACVKEYMRTRYAARAEEFREYNRNRRQDPAFREYMKAYLRDYYRRNAQKWVEYEAAKSPEQIADRNRKVRERRMIPEVRQRKAETDRIYYEQNRSEVIRKNRERDARKSAEGDTQYLEAKRASVRARRARRAKAGVFRFTPKDWRRLVNRQRGRCFYCGKVAKLEADHVVPIARGGVHSVGNIVASCGPCNRAKWSRTVMEFRLYLRRRAAAA